ncbi:MAG: hypothetical protein ACOCUR_01945 [Nanoarchaeota archaeon]
MTLFKLMNHKKYVAEKLKNYDEEHIVITYHAEEQAIFRGIDLNDVKDNLLYPKRLVFAGKQKSEKLNEEKFNCYFAYSNTQCQRYIIVLNENCVVCTVIKINRRWQRIVEKYAKI